MTLKQLRHLCHDQWMQEHRGDVIGLSLTGESLAELSAEALFGRALEIHASDEDMAEILAGGAGALVAEAVNPVTRSVVKISLAAEGDADTATVDFGSHVPHGTVTLEAAR